MSWGDITKRDGQLGRRAVAFCVLGLLPALAACNVSGSFGAPDRLYPVTDEVGRIRDYLEKSATGPGPQSDDDTYQRNNIVSVRMYVIDLEFTEYEANLLKEAQAVDFTSKVSSSVLSTVSGLMPALSTAHTLSETAALLNTLDSVYNDKVLKGQIIQNVVASMRTARHEQAAVIFANLYCPNTLYPLGIALGDVEAYYRAGTFQTGLLKLMQTVSKAENDAKAGQDASKPVPTTESIATLAANATSAAVKSGDTPSQQPMKACRAPTNPSVVYLPHPQDGLASRKTINPTVARSASKNSAL